MPHLNRPLLISTQTQVKNLFEDYLMELDGYQIGFLDYAAIDPKYLFSEFLMGKETPSISRSQRFLSTLKASNETLAYNGRIIIEAHGGFSEGKTVIGFAHGRSGDESTPILDSPLEVALKIKSVLTRV